MDYVVGWIMWLDGLCGLMDYVVGWIMQLDGLCGWMDYVVGLEENSKAYSDIAGILSEADGV